MTELRVAPLRPEQLDEAEAIERDCFSRPWTKEQLAGQLGEDHVFLGAGRDGRLLGYGAFQRILDEGYISNIAVSSDHRRQGVGGAILDALVEAAGKLNLSFLTLEVRESNTGARRLYASRGFDEVGRRRGYYEAPREDAILMTKTLSRPL